LPSDALLAAVAAASPEKRFMKTPSFEPLRSWKTAPQDPQKEPLQEVTAHGNARENPLAFLVSSLESFLSTHLPKKPM